MAANKEPIYSLKPNTATGGAGTFTFAPTMINAAADYTGVSTSNIVVHTAGADGSYVDKIGFKALGTNTGSLVRIYLNNGSVNTTATNNTLIAEIALPSTIASNTSQTQEIFFPLNLRLDATFKIYVGLATTVAAGWTPVCYAGQY